MAWIWPGIPHTHRLSSLIRQQSCVRDAGLLNKQTRLWSGESLRLQIQPLPAELLQFDLKGVERQSWCSAVKGKWTNTLPQFCATHPLWRESLMSHKYYRKLQWFHKVFRCTDGSPLFSFAPGCDLWAAAFASQTQWPVAPLRICFILHVNLWLGFFHHFGQCCLVFSEYEWSPGDRSTNVSVVKGNFTAATLSGSSLPPLS